MIVEADEIVERAHTFVFMLPVEEHEQRARALVRAAQEAEAAAAALREASVVEVVKCSGSYSEIAAAVGLSKSMVGRVKKR